MLQYSFRGKLAARSAGFCARAVVSFSNSNGWIVLLDSYSYGKLAR